MSTTTPPLYMKLKIHLNTIFKPIFNINHQLGRLHSQDGVPIKKNSICELETVPVMYYAKP